MIDTINTEQSENNLPQIPGAKRSLGKVVLREIIETLILFAIVMGVSRVLIGNYMIEQTSAVPNYLPGDRILVDQQIYKYTGGLKRGDLIVLDASVSKDRLFKRIIGLPGEMLEIRGTQVLINGKVLAEPYVTPERNQSNRFNIKRQLGPDEYWVQGDNRDGSQDSRVWNTGIKASEVVGRAWLRYWPLAKIQLIGGITYPP